MTIKERKAKLRPQANPGAGASGIPESASVVSANTGLKRLSASLNSRAACRLRHDLLFGAERLKLALMTVAECCCESKARCQASTRLDVQSYTSYVLLIRNIVQHTE
jgi:hypothetical protein